MFKTLFLNFGYEYNLSETWSLDANITHNLIDFSSSLTTEARLPSYHWGRDWLGEITIGGPIIKNLNIVFGGILDTRHRPSVPENSAIKQTYDHYNISGYVQADYKPFTGLKLITVHNLINRMELIFAIQLPDGSFLGGTRRNQNITKFSVIARFSRQCRWSVSEELEEFRKIDFRLHNTD